MKRVILLILVVSMTVSTIIPSYAEVSRLQSISETFTFGGSTFIAKTTYLPDDNEVEMYVTNTDTNETNSCIINKKNSTIEMDGVLYKVRTSEFIDFKKTEINKNQLIGNTIARATTNYDSVYVSTLNFDIDDFAGAIGKAATYLAGACALVIAFALGGPSAAAFAAGIKSVAGGLGIAIVSNLVVDLTDVKISTDQYRTTEKQFTGMGNPVYLYKWANRTFKGRLTFFSNKSDWLTLNYGDSSWWSATRP